MRWPSASESVEPAMNPASDQRPRTDRITDRIDVVIVGAGYAGVLAANRLRSSLTTDEARCITITMVNARDEFVERIRLHELAAGTRASVSIPLSEMLHDDVRLVIGTAELIDHEAKTVKVRDRDGAVERELRYDVLIYAVGSCASDAIPGAREHACLLGDLDGASKARVAISAGTSGQRIVVVGGGLTGVEAAAEIAEQHSTDHVTLVSSREVLENMRPAARRSVTRTLNRLGVTIVASARVESIGHKKVELINRNPLAFDVCVVAASFAVPDLARISGLAVDPVGRLLVDETLRSVTAPNVIGAGDAIAVPDSVGSHLRMSCAAALPLGGHAAETTLALIRGATPAAVSIGFAVQCISLGRKRGYIQPVHPDDTPRRIHLAGRLAARFKEYICRLVVIGPKKERARPGAYRAPSGPRPTAATRAQGSDLPRRGT